MEAGKGQDREVRDRIYAHEFGPVFAPHFRKLPLHGAPEGFARPELLISVLGLSWQPSCLLASWMQPKQVLLIGTKESFDSVKDEKFKDRLLRFCQAARTTEEAGPALALKDISTVEVRSEDEVEIYEAVKKFLAEHPGDPRRVAIDVTGGKKSMGMAAGLAGFLVGCPLVYVDYLGYSNRIPTAGTEYPRLLSNPLEVLGDLEKKRIFEAFDGGRFAEAERLAQGLADRLYNPREAEALAALARTYGCWDAFRFQDAHEALLGAHKAISRFATQGGWSWAASIKDRLSAHLGLLEALAAAEKKLRARNENKLSEQEGLPLVRNHLAAAQRALEQGRMTLGVMLLYSTVERFSDLLLQARHGLDDESPDYSLVLPKLDAATYEKNGKLIVGKTYRHREPSGPITFTNGLQLLVTLDPPAVDLSKVSMLQNLMGMRNKCEYEHGLLPPKVDQEAAERFVDAVKITIAPSLGGKEALDASLESHRFPRLH